MDYDELIEQHKEVAAAAVALSDAAEALARLANGTRSHIMPAPTVYDVLANIKLTCWALVEVARFLPRGLENSLDLPAIRIIDSSLRDGHVSDPKSTIAKAAPELAKLLTLFTGAADRAEEAQTQIGSQGYVTRSVPVR